MPNHVCLTGAVISHPRRLAAARALVESAPAGFLDLVLDPEPDGPPTGLRTSIRAWSQIPDGSTHHLVLEDDARLPAGLRAQAERATAAAPDAAIVLYNNWSSRNGAVLRLAALAGARWAAPVAEYTANVALILPAGVGAGFGDYARAQRQTWPDDVILARYLAQAGVRTCIAVPNLVQHGEFPSISGNDLHGLRQSACHAPLPTDTDWSAGGLFEPDAVPFFKFGVAQFAIRYGDRWLTVGGDRGSARIGLDLDQCAKEFDAALTASPARSLADRIPIGRLEAHWRTCYASGLLAARHRSVSSWPDDPLAVEAVGTIGPGGLCTELSADQLRAVQAPLADLAWTAIFAGARHSAARPAGRNIAFVGPDTALRGVLMADLSDRGHTVGTENGPETDVAIEITGTADVPRLRCTPVNAGTDTDGAPTVLRLGVPYGPEVTDCPPIADLVLQSLTRQRLQTSASLPDPLRLVHVWDIGWVLARIVQSPEASGTFDLCHDETVGPVELAELIAATIRANDIGQVGTGPAPAGPGLDTEPTKQALHWRPSVSLAEGIRTLGQWLAYEAP
ncbi:NAD(P)-dependent oxidoreductase [Catenulispora sp. NF23]|uniref:NAD(P)-dependent oxidoreductase n=1 Tax=Catenulispora pinistramenti TaxID=2705254 RepID=UPI001BACFC2B|nr:NAD(P)-dependent oxidoreductase [Catenulispora pinistramenti]MBS2532707.1 NAD(P)-dependent oxidoreductase [Catenulispora pinistramenti]